MGPRFAAVVSLLLAAAAGGLLWLTSQHPAGKDADPSKPTPSVTAKAPKDVKCPSGTPGGPSTLPKNPVVVRLCAGPNGGGVAPATVLTSDARGVAAAIRHLKRATPGSYSCPADDGSSYVLAFAYADGSTAYAVGHLSGCHFVTVGGTNYLDSGTPLHAFTMALLTYRAHKTPPSNLHPPRSCPGDPNSSLVASPVEMTMARLCLADGTHRGTAVTSSEVREIVHDWASGGAGHAIAPLSCNTTDWILYGLTDWGDPVQLASVCGLFTDNNGYFWHPSSSTLHLLGVLEARAS